MAASRESRKDEHRRASRIADYVWAEGAASGFDLHAIRSADASDASGAGATSEGATANYATDATGTGFSANDASGAGAESAAAADDESGDVSADGGNAPTTSAHCERAQAQTQQAATPSTAGEASGKTVWRWKVAFWSGYPFSRAQRLEEDGLGASGIS